MGRVDAYPSGGIQTLGPGPTLGYSEITADQTGVSTETNINGLSTTITVSAGRRIKITVHAQINNDATAGIALGRIFEGAAEVGRWVLDNVAASSYVLGSGSIVLSPSAGTHTYQAKLWKFSGAGTLVIDPDLTFPAYILVEDITGSQLPVLPQSVPVGQLAYSELATNTVCPATTDTTLPMSVNISVPAGRVVRLRAFTTITNVAVNQQTWISIQEGATVLKYALMNVPLAGNQFTLTAEAIVSPTAGAHTYTVHVNNSGGSTVYADTDRRSFIVAEDITPTPSPASTAPSSTLDYKEVITPQGSITTEVDLTGLTSTVTVAAGRRLKISGHGLAFSGVGSDVVRMSIKEGVTILQLAQDVMPPTSGPAVSLDPVLIVTPSAGTHTYKLTMQRVAGSGNLTMDCGAVYPAFLLIEDVTSATVPPTAVVPGAVVCTFATRPASPAVGTHIFETDTVTELVWTGTLWQPLGVVYSSQATGWTASTAYSDTGAVITLPPGKWMVEGNLGIDSSMATAERFTGRIYNVTSSTDLWSAFVYGSTNLGAMIVLSIPLTLTVSTQLKLQMKVAALTGAQTVQQGRIWAVPVTAIL